jgi:hypothetical protein|tara:strand:+ start:308 stop:2167 length:1860 start_codon:yes stop_codon:yes gene_type:complete
MKLIDKLKEFVKSGERHDIITTTIYEIREIFKPKEDVTVALKIQFYIFNSVWNRIPNFGIPSVLEDKLRYALKIGSGISSYNQLPISWIEDKAFSLKNFLMKDRGHITTLVCWLYSIKYSIIAFEKIVNKLIIEYKAVDEWKADYSFSHTVSILEDVQSYIRESREQQKKSGIKKSEQKLSIQMICENVPLFGETLNNFKVSVEVRRESIPVHMLEILALNNNYNKWIEYQKAFLAFVGKVMQKDGSDIYLRNTFNIDSIRNHIDGLKTFVGNSKIAIFSSAITSYKRKISEYSEIIPMRLLGLRKLTTFDKRGGYYYASTESDIRTQLMALYSHELKDSDGNVIQRGVSEAEAKVELTIMNQIADNPKWDTYEEKRKELLTSQPDSVDTTNLEDARLGTEDFGMACVDAVMELRTSLPHIGNRKSEKQINLLVNDFVNQLIIRLEDMVEDDSLFNVGATMEARFDKLIFPTYETVKKMYKSNSPKDAKQRIYETLLNELKPFLNGQTQFNVMKFTSESYKEPEVTMIDFGTTKRGEAGLDLGQRKQSMGYTIHNCIVQQKHHNRSENDVDHNISNVDYWKWYSKANFDLVMKNKQHFISIGEFNVLGDAEKLNNIFNK